MVFSSDEEPGSSGLGGYAQDSPGLLYRGMGGVTWVHVIGPGLLLNPGVIRTGTTDYRHIFQDTGLPGTGQGPCDRNDLYPCDPPALFLFSGRSGIFSHRRCAHDEDCGREGGRPGTIGGG